MNLTEFVITPKKSGHDRRAYTKTYLYRKISKLWKQLKFAVRCFLAIRDILVTKYFYNPFFRPNFLRRKTSNFWKHQNFPFKYSPDFTLTVASFEMKFFGYVMILQLLINDILWVFVILFFLTSEKISYFFLSFTWKKPMVSSSRAQELVCGSSTWLTLSVCAMYLRVFAVSQDVLLIMMSELVCSKLHALKSAETTSSNVFFILRIVAGIILKITCCFNDQETCSKLFHDELIICGIAEIVIFTCYLICNPALDFSNRRGILILYQLIIRLCTDKVNSHGDEHSRLRKKLKFSMVN